MLGKSLGVLHGILDKSLGVVLHNILGRSIGVLYSILDTSLDVVLHSILGKSHDILHLGKFHGLLNSTI